MPTELGTLPPWCREEWERLLVHEDIMRREGRFGRSEAVLLSKCHPLQRKRELWKMVHLADTLTPKVIVEIGASRGGGVFHWANGTFHPLSVQRIAAYEINGFPYDNLFRKAFPQIDFLFQHASSLEPASLNRLTDWLNGDKIDVLFIDGCKTAFRKDFDNHLPLMSPNGVILMHDIQSTAAKDWKLIEESAQFRTARIVDTSESLQAVLAERDGEPPRTDYDKWLRHWKGRGAGVGVVFLSNESAVTP